MKKGGEATLFVVTRALLRQIFYDIQADDEKIQVFADFKCARPRFRPAATPALTGAERRMAENGDAYNTVHAATRRGDIIGGGPHD